MILRNPGATWLIPADRFAFGNFGFAQCPHGEHADCGASPYSKLSAPICQNRYPSPSLRPGPSGVRPTLFGPASCGPRRRAMARICFSLTWFPIDFPAETRTSPRGRAKCSTSRFSPRSRPWQHSPVACKRIPSAVLPALRAVRLLPTPRATALLPARSSEARLASSATTRASAADIRSPLTGLKRHICKTTAAMRRGGLFICAPGFRPAVIQ